MRGAAVAAMLLVIGPRPLAAAESAVRPVERIAARAARDQVSEPDRFEVLSVRVGSADALPDDRARLEVASVDGPNASGMVVVTLRVLSGELPAFERRISVRGRVFGPAVVASRTLTGGAPIDRSAVSIADADLTRLPEPPLRAPQEVLGLVPVRTVGPGRVLTAALLRPADVVRRGDTVDLVIERPGLTIRAVGTARRDGAPGDVVEAENMASGAILSCRVRDDGSLLVIRRTADRRQGRSR